MQKRLILIITGLLTFGACGKRVEVVHTETVITKVEPCFTILDDDTGNIALKCGDMPPIIIENGRDGVDGADGADGADGDDGADAVNPTINLVTPCPELGTPQSYPETLVCINGTTLFAVYDAGIQGAVRLTQLIEGTRYITTDGRSCSFIAESSCQLSY